MTALHATSRHRPTGGISKPVTVAIRPAYDAIFRNPVLKPILILVAWLLSLSGASPLRAALTETVVTGLNFAGLGTSVAISGNTAVVGASGSGYQGGTGPGAAYVYVRSGGTWTQQALLTASNPTNQMYFGEAVAIEGDTIVVGAPGEKSSAVGVNGPQTNTGQTDAGAAYIFTRSGTTWTQRAYLKASNTRGSAAFGTGVAIYGNTVAVGSGSPKSALGYDHHGNSYGDSSSVTGVDGDGNDTSVPGAGAVYLFELRGSTWYFDTYVKASNTGAQDGFGSSVALSRDTLVVGALGEDSGASGVNGNQADNSVSAAGAAYVFTRVNSRWSQQAYLKADVPLADNAFGSSVAIWEDTVAVGSFNFAHTTAGVHIFTRSPAGTWTRQAALTPIDNPREFGFSVALWRNTLVVGEVDGGTLIQGQIHLFRRNGAGTWTRESVVTSPAAAKWGGYGFSVAIDGDAVVVGSGSEGNNTNGGLNKAFLYVGAGTQNLTVEQPAGTSVPSGGTTNIVTLPDAPVDVVFTVRNIGAQHALSLTGTPNPVALNGSGEFSMTAQPAATLSPDAASTFTVRFAPLSAGLKTVTLTIPSDDPYQPSYVVNLTGRCLSTTTDTDGDGMSDAAEFKLASLGFDWQTSQPAQVSTYFANANSAGLYTASQVQALNVGTQLLTRDAATGQFTLEFGIEKSNDLQTFTPFPFLAPQTSVQPNGKLHFQFTTPDNAAFFRLKAQ